MKSPTGRNPTGPNMQNIPIRTEEVRKIKEALIGEGRPRENRDDVLSKVRQAAELGDKIKARLLSLTPIPEHTVRIPCPICKGSKKEGPFIQAQVVKRHRYARNYRDPKEWALRFGCSTCNIGMME